MLTHSLSFFIETKRISKWHHFCKWKFLYIVNSADGSFCWNYVTDTIAIIQVTTFVVIMQVLRLYCNYAGSTFCYSYVGRFFCCNHGCDCFCYNCAVRRFCSTYASDSFCIKYMSVKFYCIYAGGNVRILYSLLWHPLFIKLTVKHLKASYQVCILPLL